LGPSWATVNHPIVLTRKCVDDRQFLDIRYHFSHCASHNRPVVWFLNPFSFRFLYPHNPRKRDDCSLPASSPPSPRMWGGQTIYGTGIFWHGIHLHSSSFHACLVSRGSQTSSMYFLSFSITMHSRSRTPVVLMIIPSNESFYIQSSIICLS
jgi:hypothetical protein